jgi:hypothetical protein
MIYDIELDGEMIVISEFFTILKDIFMTYLKLRPRHSPSWREVPKEPDQAPSRQHAVWLR